MLLVVVVLVDILYCGLALQGFAEETYDLDGKQPVIHKLLKKPNF